MKTAFTMIELIFVIVILGILSAIAIPKLNATRDDAALTTAMQQLGSVVNDAASYYLTKGSFDNVKNFQEITHVPLYYTPQGAPSRAKDIAWFGVKGKYDCLHLKLSDKGALGIRKAGDIVPGSVCDKLVDKIEQGLIVPQMYWSDNAQRPFDIRTEKLKQGSNQHAFVVFGGRMLDD